MPAPTAALITGGAPGALSEHVCMSQTVGFIQATIGVLPAMYALGYASSGPMLSSRDRKSARRGILQTAAMRADIVWIAHRSRQFVSVIASVVPHAASVSGGPYVKVLSKKSPCARKEICKRERNRLRYHPCKANRASRHAFSLGELGCRLGRADSNGGDARDCRGWDPHDRVDERRAKDGFRHATRNDDIADEADRAPNGRIRVARHHEERPVFRA